MHLFMRSVYIYHWVPNKFAGDYFVSIIFSLIYLQLQLFFACSGFFIALVLIIMLSTPVLIACLLLLQFLSLSRARVEAS